MGSGNIYKRDQANGCISRSDDDPTLSSHSKRPRGITSIVKGSGITRGMIFGLSFDSQIHVYETSNLGILRRDYGDNRTKRFTRCMSYSIKLGMHDDGDRFVSGGQDGNAFIWDTHHEGGDTSVSNAKTESFLRVLGGHTGEVGAVDIAGNMVVTCGIDRAVKIWSVTA